MPQDIRLWEIKNGEELREINPSKLDLEEMIEKWLELDISGVTPLWWTVSG